MRYQFQLGFGWRILEIEGTDGSAGRRTGRGEVMDGGWLVDIATRVLVRYFVSRPS